MKSVRSPRRIEDVPRRLHVLGIDCATASCSAAISVAGEIVSHRFEEMARGQAEVLIPMIEGVLAEARIGFDNLDLLGVTVGPGAFTGVRIGLSTAQSLSMAAGLPLVGVTTLEAVARAHRVSPDPVLIALETKRTDIYFQLFGTDGAAITAAAAAEAAGMAAMMPPGPIGVAGDASLRAHQALVAAGCIVRRLEGPEYPDARWVAAIAADRFESDEMVPPAPLYLRSPDVGPPRKRL